MAVLKILMAANGKFVSSSMSEQLFGKLFSPPVAALQQYMEQS